MDDNIDLMSLSKQQLVHLVQVRGQAISFHSQADQRLFEKVDTKTLEDGDMEKFMAAKIDILHSLITAEEKILAGQATSATN